MYNIEVFTRQGIDTNAAKEYVHREAGMVPAVYDKGTHYVTNQKLTLEILKEISDCEEVLQVSGEYTGCSASIGQLHELLRNQKNSSKYSSNDDMFLDNKTIAVEQEEEEKNIKLQKIRIDFSFKREVFFIVAVALMGAIVMAIPMTFLYAGIGSGYYLTWIVFGHMSL